MKLFINFFIVKVEIDTTGMLEKGEHDDELLHNHRNVHGDV